MRCLVSEINIYTEKDENISVHFKYFNYIVYFSQREILYQKAN